MREKRWFPILYMFGVTAFFSSIIIAFASATRGRVEANAELAFERAVLEVVPGLSDVRLSNAEVHPRFTEMVEGPTASSGGAYLVKEDGHVVAYALPFSGQGFWAPIGGILGIEPDQKTVTGIAFYEQNETPGLGAEIVKPAFRNQFRGKVLAAQGKPLGMKRPGGELDDSTVHAITGATQTSTRLDAIINAALAEWQSKVGKEGTRS
ncbi:MAG TPA: FMN-binding protein [Sedimentisphaerales bacterium]|nr:FMN-binding protein [Sedimentisphaerales bacterium]HRS12852.1 FMN-binding protein [Sedimentisphaerales bacterium]HRV49463.1 FMN-binding protein [Sedimentisphaerales bacterium]